MNYFQYRERLKYWRGECDKNKAELTNVHVSLLKTLQNQVQIKLVLICSHFIQVFFYEPLLYYIL